MGYELVGKGTAEEPMNDIQAGVRSVHCVEFVAWAKEYSGPQFHAVLCDPPYDLSFMGKSWDRDSDYKAWGEALMRLLHPGAIVFMFGGTRTWHRLATGMENAGFAMIDTLMYLYGTGFPKAQDISKLIDKRNGDKRKTLGRKRFADGTFARKTQQLGKCGIYGKSEVGGGAYEEVSGSDDSEPWSGHKSPALKPAWEPILAFRAHRQGKTYAQLAQEFGSGCLNVDGGRISIDSTERDIIDERSGSDDGKRDGIYNDGVGKRVLGERFKSHADGRYPANLILECLCEHTELVDAPKSGYGRADFVRSERKFKGCEKVGKLGDGREALDQNGKIIRHTNPECPAYMLDEQAGERGGGFATRGASTRIYGGGKGFTQATGEVVGIGDKGGASRFFYTSKASRKEREAGLENAPTRTRIIDNGTCESCGKVWIDEKRDGACCVSPKRSPNPKSSIRNNHPTVKPLSLTKWLATLLLPPDSVKPRRLLIPFAGSGSEMIGAMQAGWDEIVGIEQSQEYCEIAEARLRYWENHKEEPQSYKKQVLIEPVEEQFTLWKCER